MSRIQRHLLLWLRGHPAQLLLVVVCAIYGGLLLRYDGRPTMDRSTDAIEYIAASQDLLHYKHFYHGPGYSAVVFVASKFWPSLPLLNVARLVSTLCALTALIATFALGRRLWGDPMAGLVAAAALTLSAQFWLSATWALSDMLATALMVVAALGLWHVREGNRWAAVWAGLATGAAYTTRYVAGYVLFATLIAALLFQRGRRWPRVRSALLFGIGFVVPALPWILRSVYLWKRPFWSLNHLTLAAKMFALKVRDVGLVNPQQFPDALSVIAYDPGLFLQSWSRTFFTLPSSLMEALPFVGVLVLVALIWLGIDAARRRPLGSKHLIIVHLIVVSYAVLASMVLEHPRYLLPLFPFLALYLGGLCKALRMWTMNHPYVRLGRRDVPSLWLVAGLSPIVLAAGLAYATPRIAASVREIAYKEPYEYGIVADCLRRSSKESALILSTAPHITFLAGRPNVNPGIAVLQQLTPEEVVPFLRQKKIDDLVVESRLGIWKFLRAPQLLSPSDPAVPGALEVVCAFQAPSAVIYRLRTP